MTFVLDNRKGLSVQHHFALFSMPNIFSAREHEFIGYRRICIYRWRRTNITETIRISWHVDYWVWWSSHYLSRKKDAETNDDAKGEGSRKTSTTPIKTKIRRAMQLLIVEELRRHKLRTMLRAASSTRGTINRWRYLCYMKFKVSNDKHPCR